VNAVTDVDDGELVKEPDGFTRLWLLYQSYHVSVMYQVSASGCWFCSV